MLGCKSKLRAPWGFCIPVAQGWECGVFHSLGCLSRRFLLLLRNAVGLRVNHPPSVQGSYTLSRGSLWFLGAEHLSWVPEQSLASLHSSPCLRQAWELSPECCPAQGMNIQRQSPRCASTPSPASLPRTSTELSQLRALQGKPGCGGSGFGLVWCGRAGMCS